VSQYSTIDIEHMFYIKRATEQIRHYVYKKYTERGEHLSRPNVQGHLSQIFL